MPSAKGASGISRKRFPTLTGDDVTYAVVNKRGAKFGKAQGMSRQLWASDSLAFRPEDDLSAP